MQSGSDGPSPLRAADRATDLPKSTVRMIPCSLWRSTAPLDGNGSGFDGLLEGEPDVALRGTPRLPGDELGTGCCASTGQVAAATSGGSGHPRHARREKHENVARPGRHPKSNRLSCRAKGRRWRSAGLFGMLRRLLPLPWPSVGDLDATLVQIPGCAQLFRCSQDVAPLTRTPAGFFVFVR